MISRRGTGGPAFDRRLFNGQLPVVNSGNFSICRNYSEQDAAFLVSDRICNSLAISLASCQGEGGPCDSQLVEEAEEKRSSGLVEGGLWQGGMAMRSTHCHASIHSCSGSSSRGSITFILERSRLCEKL